MKKACLFIEKYYEEWLQNNPVWSIFALKNMWRSDRMDLSVQTTDLNQLRSQSQAPHFAKVIEVVDEGAENLPDNS